MTKTKIALGAALSIAGLTLAASAALAQTTAPAARQSLNVTPSGNVRLLGTVSAVSPSSLTVSVWGLNVTVGIGSNTKVVRRYGGKVSSAMAEIQNGDTVEVNGMIPSGGTLNSIDAKTVKDDSIQERYAGFSGTVSNVSAIGFTLTARNGKSYAVTASSNTRVTLNGKNASLTDVQNGDLASVSGVWDRNQSTVLATRISARTPKTSTGGTATSTSR